MLVGWAIHLNKIGVPSTCNREGGKQLCLLPLQPVGVYEGAAWLPRDRAHCDCRPRPPLCPFLLGGGRPPPFAHGLVWLLLRKQLVWTEPSS